MLDFVYYTRWVFRDMPSSFQLEAGQCPPMDAFLYFLYDNSQMYFICLLVEIFNNTFISTCIHDHGLHMSFSYSCVCLPLHRSRSHDVNVNRLNMTVKNNNTTPICFNQSSTDGRIVKYLYQKTDKIQLTIIV
jgi:hypothetical protein